MNNTIGDNLKKFRKLRGMTQKDVAVKSKISTVSYSNIENNKTFPKDETISAIAAALGVLASDIWQRNDSLKDIRFRAKPQFLMRERIIQFAESQLKKIKELDQILQNNQTETIIKEFNNIAQNKQTPESTASMLRKIWGLGNEPIHNIVNLLESKGIKILPYKAMSELFYGMSIGPNGNGPAIIFNNWEGITVERWIFSIAHELGHLLLHQTTYDYNVKNIIENEEKEADIFASHFLMPTEAFISAWNQIQTDKLVKKILVMKSIFKVSWKTIVYRLSEITGNNNWWKKMYSQFKLLGINVIGHREPLPLKPTAVLEDDQSNMHLKLQVKQALQSKKITLKEASSYLEIDEIKIQDNLRLWDEYQELTQLLNLEYTTI